MTRQRIKQNKDTGEWFSVPGGGLGWPALLAIGICLFVIGLLVGTIL